MGGKGLLNISAQLALLFLLVLALRAAPATPTFVVRSPTVLAFFPPVTQEDLRDGNETLNDFQFYASQLRDAFARLGIDFEEVYARSFRVTTGGKTTIFKPGRVGVGYYLIAPGKRPRIEHGIEAAAGLPQIAKEYFGIDSK